MQVKFIRHGQSDWNLDGRIQGQGIKIENSSNLSGSIIESRGSKLLDSSMLTAEGREQAKQLAEKIVRWTQEKGRVILISSDLLRCKETTEELENSLKARGKEVVVLYDARLREADHGRLSGLLEQEYTEMSCFQQYKDLSPDNQYNIAMDPEFGESYSLVADRVYQAVLEYTNTFQNEELFFVTHGGPMRAIYTYLTHNFAPFSTEKEINGQIKNCSVMKIDLRKPDKIKFLIDKT